MSDEKPLRIVLKGKNTMLADQKVRDSGEGFDIHGICLLGTDTIIEGSGELISNMHIFSGESLTIRDCDLTVNGKYNGIDCGEKELCFENANVHLTSEGYSSVRATLWPSGVRDKNGKLTIKESNVYVEAKENSNRGVLIGMGLPNQYADSPEDMAKLPADYKIDPSQLFFMSDDTIVTDKEGNALYLCPYQLSHVPYYTFSREGINLTYLKEETQISRSVFFKSAKKQKQLDAIQNVTSLIDAIGTVTLDKEAAIRAARSAYNGLDSFGDMASYVKEKVQNYQVLVDAEATLAQLKQEGGKNDTEDLEESDKEIQVGGKTYIIKTPKIKSLKSKKTASATIKYSKVKSVGGYQISYSTTKKFKKKKTKNITIKKNKTGKKTIKSLKSGKIYYFRVRSFVKVEGKKYYGNWSKVKKVKVR